MSDYDPYETNDPSDDEYARRPDPDAYASPGQTPEQTPDQDPEQAPEFDPSYELAETPATPPPRPSAGPSYVAVPCTHCGYNLTGVAIGGNCPECGAMVDNSLYAAGAAPANGMAITSMVIGILAVSGMCCCPTGYLGIVGLIFGLVAKGQLATGAYNNASKGMATAGIICSSIGLGLAVLWTALAVFG